MNPKGPLYEQVALKVAGLIHSGAYRVGDPVPSVRALSRQLDVSVATVLGAYRVLQVRGLIEPRPQSGYYVRPRPLVLDRGPEKGASTPAPAPVNVNDLGMKICRDARNPELIPLGAAFPRSSLLPLEELRRILGRIFRRDAAAASVIDGWPGCRPLRIQLAQRAMLAGCPLTPDDFVTTCGAQEAISLALRATCRPGDTVAVESPIFFGILQAIEVLGLKAVEIEAHPREGIDLGSLRAAIRRHRVRCVVAIPTFNNPLGSLAPDEKKKELVRMLAARDVPLLEDDLYGDLHFALERPKMAKAFDIKGLVLACGSFSKSVATGWRVGWIAPGRFGAEIERLKMTSTLATTTPLQLAIAEFMAHGGYERALRLQRRSHARSVDELGRAVIRHFPSGTGVSTPEGGFVVWVRMPERVNSLELYRRALKEGITTAPGPIFSPRQRYRNCVRLNAGAWSPEVERSIATLGRLSRL